MDSRLRREIGSLLWIGFEGCAVDADVRACLGAGDAGGAILFRRNLPGDGTTTDLAALRALNEDLHRCGDRVLISVDQEGGRVQRIKAPLRHYPPMLCHAAMTEADAQDSAGDLGRSIGTELRDLGFDIDFAPVLDVHTNPANPIIGDRAFSEQPERAAACALAFARGLAEAGIIGCGKHFPGHGDTDTDSHLSLPRLDHEMERLQAVELVPFREAARAGLPMIMTAHVVFAALDSSVPATLSRAVITGLLRESLGYRGVVVSDDLDMKAIADNFGVGEAAVAAIEAGCDVLLLCQNRDHQEQARQSLHARASTSAAFRERIAESAARVAALKPAF